MTVRFSTWVDSLIPTVTSLASTDKVAVVTNAPDTRAISRDNLFKSVYVSVLTEDGDLATLSGGNPVRITRSSLANDTAFTSKYTTLATLTVDGDLYTRTSGVVTRMSRSDLANDTAFTSKYATLATLTTDGDLYTRASGVVTRLTRASLADDIAFTSKYLTTAATSLGDLSDVDTSGVVNGSTLVYDGTGTSWVVGASGLLEDRDRIISTAVYV
jgi:hypothetical protein